jgi:hypothetical protein
MSWDRWRRLSTWDRVMLREALNDFIDQLNEANGAK